MDYLREYQRWCDSEKAVAEFGSELKKIKNDENEIKQWFSCGLTFGTAGLRGVMTCGTNAMNIFTVRQATQGFAEVIKKNNGEQKGVVIGYDCRNNSEKFAKAAAEVMAANGIKTYIFDDMRPTPVLSFAIRHLGCIAGINVTASHNPAKYNGYKAYWEDGAQLGPVQADGVFNAMSKIDIFDGALTVDFDEAVKCEKITVIGSEVDEKYLENVKKQAVSPEIFDKVSDDLAIVYTPLYGTGRVLVPEIMRRCGLKKLYTVEEQMTPDGNFPGMPNPNPEFPDVFKKGIELAEKVKSDLIVATDPDSDRVGIMARTKDGFKTLTGNQTGALLMDYVISSYEQKGILPKEAYAIKTIVTTELVSKICQSHSVKLHNVLTGFKFIGEVIKNYEAEGKGENFVLGFEESYGYLKGTYARDKDAVVATMLICEMAAYYKLKNMTLYDALTELYKKYGYYVEGVENIYMEGLDGKEKMAAVMENLRNNPPIYIGESPIVSVKDYKTGIVLNTITGQETPTGLPSSNVLYYTDNRGNVIVCRPSGTEPKLKLYFLVHGVDKASADKVVEECRATMRNYVKI